jgi:dolichol kinase
MSVVVESPHSLEELLHGVAVDVERLRAELSTAGNGEPWSERIGEAREALSDRLSRLGDQLRTESGRARAALEELRQAVESYPYGPADPEDTTGLVAFGKALTERYEALAEALAARRLVEPVEIAAAVANRRPKLVRALFHVAMGVSCAALYQLVVDRTQALWILAAFVSFFGSVEIVRRFSRPLNDFWVDKVFGKVARPQERYRTNSATYYMLGMAVIVLLAPRLVVCAALLVLAFGDPLASAAGHRWGGRLRFPNGKSLLGSVTFVLAAAIAAGLYLIGFGGLPLATLVVLAVAMAIAGALAELLSGPVDDNLTIPIVASAAGMAVMWAMG